MVTCRSCGRATHTAVSHTIQVTDWGVQADWCFAAFVDGRYVPGCAYELASGFDREFAHRIIEHGRILPGSLAEEEKQDGHTIPGG